MKKLTFFLILMFATSLVFAQVPRPYNPGGKSTLTEEQIQAAGKHHPNNPSSSTVILDFEGLACDDNILGFYNGGTSFKGHSGTNYGVYFSDNATGLPTGGCSNACNCPSPITCMWFNGGITWKMNVPAGFINSISFYYTSFPPLTVEVYSELDGTGNLLASNTFPTNWQNGGCVNCMYCHWDQVGVSFAGVAKSVSFTAPDPGMEFMALDNIAFEPAPPCIPTLSEWGLIILALLMVAAGMVYIRKRQYSFAMAGSADVSEGRKNLFNRRSYFIILAGLLGIAMVVFAVEIIFSIAVPVRDIAGALVSSVILAYILQLVNAFRKE